MYREDSGGVSVVEINNVAEGEGCQQGMVRDEWYMLSVCSKQQLSTDLTDPRGFQLLFGESPWIASDAPFVPRGEVEPIGN